MVKWLLIAGVSAIVVILMGGGLLELRLLLGYVTAVAGGFWSLSWSRRNSPHGVEGEEFGIWVMGAAMWGMAYFAMALIMTKGEWP